MKHEFAVATHAVERYLMGEMPNEERDDFEDHFFSCESCAEDLRFTARFIDGAKAQFRDEVLTAPRSSFSKRFRFPWLSPALASLAAAACAVVIYQNAVTIPALRAPRALPALLLDLTSRAAAPHLGPSDPLHFLIAAEQPATTPTLWAELSTDSGRILHSGRIAAPAPQQAIDVYFPGTLTPGRYVITIRSARGDSPGEQIARQSFEVATVQEHTN